MEVARSGLWVRIASNPCLLKRKPEKLKLVAAVICFTFVSKRKEATTHVWLLIKETAKSTSLPVLDGFTPWHTGLHSNYAT